MVSSVESSEIGGMAHLTNFMGTDTVPALLAARKYYGEMMAGFSIPAAEHSTITSWGREGEVDAYRNMVRTFGHGTYAVVSDSYDLFNAVRVHWGQTLRNEVVSAGGTLVVRPDSGDPTTMVMMTLRILDEEFGSEINEYGYKVLNNVRVIQGDGINEDSIYKILKAITDDGFSVQNVAFGMGGALLQGVNRDTNSFAMKTSAIQVNGEMRDVYKDPVTDKGKTSKKGQLELTWVENPPKSGEFEYNTVKRGSYWEDWNMGDRPGNLVLQTVFENGEVTNIQTLSEIRSRS